MLTGNYTFFNLLTIILCAPLIDDDAFYWLLPFLRSPVVSPSSPSTYQSSLTTPPTDADIAAVLADKPAASEPLSGNVLQMFVDTLDSQPTMSCLLLTMLVGFLPYTVISLLGIERNRNPGAYWSSLFFHYLFNTLLLAL